MLFVDRATRCITAWRVVEQATEAVVQDMLDDPGQAARYYSDQFPGYSSVTYLPSQRHDALPNKSQTYTVEGVNADLRHYLARLRRRSRCFSRSLQALRAAVKLFVYAYNRRQLHRWYFPHYSLPLMAFV